MYVNISVNIFKNIFMPKHKTHDPLFQAFNQTLQIQSVGITCILSLDCVLL